jgi:hypothetical protein
MIRALVAEQNWTTAQLLNLPKALRHPSALSILIVSLALAAAVNAIPALRYWSPGAMWIILWGVVAYLAAVAVLHWSRSHDQAIEVSQLRAIRSSMARHLRDSEEAAGRVRPSELNVILRDRLQQLDELIPALRQLAERQRALNAKLAAYESGRLPPPEPVVMRRLEGIRDRQNRAIGECVRQAANADATLMALLQEGDDERLGAKAKSWAEDFLSLHETLTEVLLGADEVTSLAELPEYQLVPEEVLAAAVSHNGHAAQSEPAFARMVEDALRKLNRADLGACDLVTRLPRSLTAIRQTQQLELPSDPTPLDQGRALRALINSAIERLQPTDLDSSTTGALQYYILHEEYVLERSNVSIQTRRGVSESTFHRLRREAISILARELQHQENASAA